MHAPTCNGRPNIVLMLADDMGYSDIGCYGGEIETPNIDRLAADGVRFTQCYNTARCCPSRASLLTGLHPHQTGIGHMTNPPDREPAAPDPRPAAYQGYLNRQCVTVAEVLRDAGYHTLMSGKWHLGIHDRTRWPLQRGFDRYYGIVSGGTNYFRPTPPRGLTLGNDHIGPEGDDYYLTDAFTDYAAQFVEDATRTDDRPFLMYLAYTAPHWPLHAPKEDIDKYRGQYMKGWDVLRQERYERMIDLGLVDRAWPLSPRDARAWHTLDEAKKREMDLRMAIYAAQVDRMDQGIGRVVRTLDDLGRLDNTIIMFLSDNGGCAEGGELGGGDPNDLESDRGWVLSYGRAWANLSNTPYRRYKHWVHEGGMSTPLVVRWPAGIRDKGAIREQPVYLPDFMPTWLELTGATYPTHYHGNDIPPMEGSSLRPAIAEDRPIDRDAMCWEHEGNRAIRMGDWKCVTLGREGEWELYNLKDDRTELRDLAQQDSSRALAMAKRWNDWAVRCKVKPYPAARG